MKYSPQTRMFMNLHSPSTFSLCASILIFPRLGILLAVFLVEGLRAAKQVVIPGLDNCELRDEIKDNFSCYAQFITSIHHFFLRSTEKINKHSTAKTWWLHHKASLIATFSVFAFLANGEEQKVLIKIIFIFYDLLWHFALAALGRASGGANGLLACSRVHWNHKSL